MFDLNKSGSSRSGVDPFQAAWNWIPAEVEWSPNAHHEATKLFASNMDPLRAQRFYNLVLRAAGDFSPRLTSFFLE